jgi:peroxiredoxin
MRLRTTAGLALALLFPVGAAADRATPPPIGSAVPDFQATSVQGEPLSLRAAAAGSKAVVLVFLSTVCPYANYFSGHIRELAETYGPKGVLFVGVYSNGWESRAEATAHGRERGFSFPIIKDEGHVIADAIGATRTPEAFVVDGSGRLRYRGRVMSKQEAPELRRALEAVLDGRPVRTPVTKAFGCAIGGS